MQQPDESTQRVVCIFLIRMIRIFYHKMDVSSFAWTVKKIKRDQKAFQDGSEILEGILGAEVDLDSNDRA